MNYRECIHSQLVRNLYYKSVTIWFWISKILLWFTWIHVLINEMLLKINKFFSLIGGVNSFSLIRKLESNIQKIVDPSIVTFEEDIEYQIFSEIQNHFKFTWICLRS